MQENETVESGSISLEDMLAVASLLGETAAVSAGHDEKKRKLLSGVCQLMGADAWVWISGSMAGQSMSYTHFMYGGLSEDEYASLVKRTEDPEHRRLNKWMIQRAMAHGQHVSYTMNELNNSQQEPDAMLVSKMEKTNMQDYLVSATSTGELSVSVIVFYKKLGSGGISQRDKLIANVVLGEVPWIHKKNWNESLLAPFSTLYPQQRVVLNLLLDGLGRKQISSQMDLRENTVAGYTRDIYKCFEVKTHAQLMHRFQSLGGSQ